MAFGQVHGQCLLQFILELFACLDSTSADVGTQFELSFSPLPNFLSTHIK